MKPPTVPAARSLQIALDALMGLLLVMALAVTIQRGGQWAWAGIASAIAFAAVYISGRRRIRLTDVDAPRGQWWPVGAWIVALTALWAVLLSVVDVALWLAFPLMFLQMHVLGPRRGPWAVALTTLIAATGALGQGLAPVGSILGPVLGAGVAIGVVLGLEAVVRESQGRLAVIAELTRTRANLAAIESERATALERERLAREIHDTLAQGFSSIDLLLRAADQSLVRAGADGEHGAGLASARHYLATAQESVHENLLEARRVVRALAPPALDSANLIGALERLAARTRVTAGIAVTMAVSGQPVELPAPIETALLRIAQSALANVVAHAGATRVGLTVTFHDCEVSLDVVDNGCGFDPGSVRASLTGGFGITAMRSRVAELGGCLTIESGPEAHTQPASASASASASPSASASASPSASAPGLRSLSDAEEEPRSVIGTALAVQIPLPTDGGQS